MKTRTKLVFLELVAGVFGWMWLAAGVAAFYFIITAIWFDGSWGMILAAIATSIICNWLAKGFRDNKIRVAYEAELISHGMTAEEAGKSWARAYLGQSQNATKNKDEKDSEIIRNYAMYIEKNPIIDEIKDHTYLPYTRDQILDALVNAFGKTNDANQKNAIKVLAITLAHFQPNVGKEPLTLLGAGLSNLLNDKNIDIDKIADSLGAENFSTVRYHEFYEKVQNDTKKIMTRFDKWQ